MNATKDPVAALQRLMPHAGSLRGRVSDADAAELAAQLEECAEDADPDRCLSHPRALLTPRGDCAACREEEQIDAYCRWLDAP